MNAFTEYEKWRVPPPGADKAWFRERGYVLERLIGLLLEKDNLAPRLSYKIPGEQIDGSFSIGTQFFLLEAKWHKDSRPASDIFAFRGKVEGKLAGTLGVFISMSGFSDDAPDALQKGKDITILLFDQMDFEATLDPKIGFYEVLMTKMRAAAEAGAVYLPYRSLAVSRRPDKATPVRQSTLKSPSGSRETLLIVCEGALDELILLILAQRFAEAKKLKRDVKVVVANGKVTAPRIANAVGSQVDGKSLLLVLVDSDGDVKGSQKLLTEGVKVPGAQFSIPDPGIETWLKHDSDSFKARLRKETSRGIKQHEVIHQLVFDIDLNALFAKDESFATVVRAMTE